MYQLWNDFV